jgi:hypothetical protein
VAGVAYSVGMKGAERQPRDLFDDPAVYRIQVLGRMTDELSGRVSNLTRREVALKDGAHVTLLEAELRDQSALASFLEMLYEMHLPILSVELLAGLPKSGRE